MIEGIGRKGDIGERRYGKDERWQVERKGG
jgi:hypothetical protein